MAIENKNRSYPIEYPYLENVEKIAQLFQTDIERGLTEEETQKKIEEYGLNSFKAQKQKKSLLILVDQFKSPIVVLLVVAATFSFLFEHWYRVFLFSGFFLLPQLWVFLWNYKRGDP